MGPHQQFLAGAGPSTGGARRLDAAERRHPPRQGQDRPGLRADPAIGHHQDVGAQPQRLLHVAQRTARQEGRPHRGADQGGARQGLPRLARPRPAPEGCPALGRSGHADAGARRRRCLRRHEAALQREGDRRADGFLRHVELFQPLVRGAARRPRTARPAHRIPGRVTRTIDQQKWGRHVRDQALCLSLIHI